VIGSMNLYASAVDAFDGRVDAVADAVGAAAHEAVTNADLGFTSRERARRGPSDLEEFDAINRAIGVLISARNIESMKPNPCCKRSHTR
jgi:hypothetical protein